MRTGLVALISAVVTMPGAWAASFNAMSCRDNGSLVVAYDWKEDPNWSSRPSIAHPENIGREFRLIKRTDGPFKNTNHIILQSGDKTFVIREKYGSPPGPVITSAAGPVKDRPAQPEAVTEIGRFITQTITNGPLQGLRLKVKVCGSSHYEGKTPSGKLYVTVTSVGGDQYKVDLETYGPGPNACIGQMGTVGRLRGNAIETEAPASGEPAFCPVKIMSDDRAVRVVETGDSCDARGMMCSFNGTVRKVK